jgi:hypothetical protein
MWRTYRSFVALAVFAILKLPVASAAELPEAIARCADVADNLERLACYDRQNPPRHATATPNLPMRTLALPKSYCASRRAVSPLRPALQTGSSRE